MQTVVRRVLALVALAGCASRAGVPGPAPGAPSAGVTVTLAWTAAVDLDLYVTDPALETVYFANPRTASGGVLERDARCADPPAAVRVERARWTHPPRGRYRVGVDFLEACGAAAGEVTYRLTVDVDGRRRETVGRARVSEREPQVLDFTVAGPPAGEGSR
jgi:hypothetical protein